MTLTNGSPSSGADHTRRTPRDRRTVTVMFADVVGSTASTAGRELEAGSSPVEIVTSVVERYGGTVNKLLGDGVMATFGAPVMLEDHAPRTCRCALAIQAALTASGSSVKMRIGINSGEALITDVIAGAHRSYDTHGPTVNLVSRIEAEALPGSVFISEGTFRLVQGAFTCREIGARSLKGFSEPQLLYELLHEETDAKLRGLAGHRTATPFMGREQDLTAATAMLASLQGGKGGLLLVVGEAGVGKSRLLTEMRHSSSDALRWLEGHCDAFTERISFWPFIELLRPIVGLSDASRRRDTWADLQHNLTDLLRHEVDELLPYIATFLGIEVAASEQEHLRHLEPEVMGAQIFRAARRLFERIAEHGPIILVLEDLHWADGSSRELLDHLLPLSRTLPILFVVLSRPDPERLVPLRVVAARDPGTEQFRELVLAPLTASDSQRLLIAILGNDERLARLRGRILSTTEGNPFFMEEVVCELVDLGALVHDAVRGTWSVHDLDITIPPTVEAVLMARIDRLEERLRDVLGVAAVLGRTFLHRLLRAVTAADVDEPLERLSTSDLIEQLRTAPELTYLFRHALAHQAVYQGLLLEKRNQLHARIAAILEELYAERINEITSLLAFHYARAQMPERSLRFLVEAAEQSARMAADSEALELLEEAVSSRWNEADPDPNPGQRARIEWQLGEIHFRRGDHERAEKHLLHAIEIFGEPMPTGRIYIILAISREFIRHIGKMLLALAKTPKLTHQIAPSDETRIRPYEKLGVIYCLSDQVRLLLVILRAANFAARLGWIEGVIKTLAALGLGFCLAGWPRIGSRYHRRALAIADRFDDAVGGAFANTLWGACLIVGGHWRDAERVLDDARRTADRTGDLLVWSDASGQMCTVWNETAEFERTFKLSETMIARGQEGAFKPALRWGLMERGKALWRTGCPEEAYPVLSQAFEMSIADKDFIGYAGAGGDLAMTLIALRRPDEAARLLRGLHQRIIESKIRMYPMCGVYLALAELALLGLDKGTAEVRGARRACRDVRRLGRAFSMARPSALRLEGRLALLSRQPKRAERIWRRAAALAEKLGARYELSLIERERDAHRMSVTAGVD